MGLDKKVRFYCVVCKEWKNIRVGCKSVSHRAGGGWCCLRHSPDELDKAILKMSEKEDECGKIKTW